MLEQKLTATEGQSRLYWECGIEWARREESGKQEIRQLRERERGLQAQLERMKNGSGGTAVEEWRASVWGAVGGAPWRSRRMMSKAEVESDFGFANG